MAPEIRLKPIGLVHTPRKEAIDDHWGKVVSTIELDPDQFAPEALLGLDAFSHIEVVFFFHGVPEAKIETSARHPRDRTDWPRVGIFAQRSKNRPNRIGVSACRLLNLEGLTITVEGLDAIDGTPVVDIKPHMAEFAPRGEVIQPAWSKELMTDY
ncbi:MAG TPA: tRNA (N6-threonylcarbamoyladenosine(37)-N6)-methyltransferase TrmO [Bryobacteraceae bacterium]|jgi:tRNA-Thr(GGU) m(6)t(6)A37 methyltransferase TsaA|nr:tRNA (N6-threonylcarbamoyladenosine(37)-N6)-methyltransferase TrmO [Bryobacteraceae bacterium]